MRTREIKNNLRFEGYPPPPPPPPFDRNLYAFTPGPTPLMFFIRNFYFISVFFFSCTRAFPRIIVAFYRVFRFFFLQRKKRKRHRVFNRAAITVKRIYGAR